MKMVKALLLAGAAGIAAASGAQAADLPVKARAAEYVKVCSAYGAGFYYIPGTDTCIKIGGYLFVDYAMNATGSHGPYWSGANARDTRADTPGYNTRVRTEISFDTRTQTEWGTLRSYIRGGWELNSDQLAVGAYNGYRGAQQFSRAFIQFAGFTIGKTQSFFDFYAGALGYTTPLYAGSNTGSGLNLVAYTANFGGGLSATISLEEPGFRRTAILDSTVAGNFSAGVTMGQNATGAANSFGYYRAQQYPDVVANLRLDQPWGSAQVMGAIHDASAGCGIAGGAVNCISQLGDATGYAVGGGIKFNLPFAAGDELWLQGTYAKGATSYLGPYKPHGQDSIAIYRDGGPGALGNGKFTSVLYTDAIVLGNGRSEMTSGYQFTIAAQHFWTPGLRTSVFGGYTKIMYSDAATTAFCTGAVSSQLGPRAGVRSCDPDFALWQVGTRTIWSPVANLDVGVEVLYSKIDQNHVGNFTLPANGGRGAGAYQASDADMWTGMLRVTRNFWP